MRTTIDLPDDLFRRAKAEAALRGIKFKDLAAELFRQGLGEMREDSARKGRQGPIPVAIPAAGRNFTALTNAELFEMIDREDDRKKVLLAE